MSFGKKKKIYVAQLQNEVADKKRARENLDHEYSKMKEECDVLRSKNELFQKILAEKSKCINNLFWTVAHDPLEIDIGIETASQQSLNTCASLVSIHQLVWVPCYLRDEIFSDIIKCSWSHPRHIHSHQTFPWEQGFTGYETPLRFEEHQQNQPQDLQDAPQSREVARNETSAFRPPYSAHTAQLSALTVLCTVPKLLTIRT